MIKGFGKQYPAQPRWAEDETWDPGEIVKYWAGQPDDDQLSDRELGLKSWSLFAVACWPRCSDGARIPRDTVIFSTSGEVLWRYEGTKSLRLPVLGPQLGIAASVVERVCVARTLKKYLSRTASCAHQNRVWCSTVARNGVKGPLSHKGDTHRVWMREVMDRCGIDPKFTGGSVRQAASSRAIDDGWEPAAVLRLGQWKSFAMWNRHYNRSRLQMQPGPTVVAR